VTAAGGAPCGKRIFTFWEPRADMPAYIELCIGTWRKFLPDYEIVIAGYADLDRLLGKNYYDPVLYRSFSLPKQADAIRAALLARCGGVWLDADTIITSSAIRGLLRPSSAFTLLGWHIGFIVTTPPPPTHNL
jgi:mannosyltransferase OCH1-like enzyme